MGQKRLCGRDRANVADSRQSSGVIPREGEGALLEGISSVAWGRGVEEVGWLDFTLPPKPNNTGE